MLWMRPALLSGFGLSFVLAKLENEAGYSDETPDFDRVSEGMEIYYYLFFGAFILSSFLAMYKMLRYRKETPEK